MLLAQVDFQLAKQRFRLLMALFDHARRNGVAGVIARVPLSPQCIENAPVLVADPKRQGQRLNCGCVMTRLAG